MKTCDLLCEHAEKIVATIGLKKSMNQLVKNYLVYKNAIVFFIHLLFYYSVIDNAIRRVLKERPPRPHLPAGLTPQDIYFSQVSHTPFKLITSVELATPL